jgi:alpha-tubulin suppressor-like RCC1 family protein
VNEAKAEGTTEDDAELAPVTECPADQFLQDGSCHLDAVQISAGLGHFCVLLRDTTVRCAGNNNEGTLGDGTFASSAVPVTVTGLSGVRQVSAGGRSTCAAMEDGTVNCWGHTILTASASASTTKSALTPEPIRGIDDAVAVATGNATACALLRTGAVSCWGQNSVGQLGTGGIAFETADSAEPVSVLLSSGDVAVSLGATSGNACAVLASGRVKCWGSDFETTPVDVGFEGAVGVGTSDSLTCAWNAQGELHCYGSSADAVLGPESDESASLVPTPVQGIGSVREVAVNGGYVCFLDRDTSLVHCTGRNGSGALGDPSLVADSWYAPVAVVGLSDVSALATASGYTCALRTEGSVWCWGNLQALGATDSARAAPWAAW